MFNKTIMLGNLTRDIELKYLPSGTAVANSALAINRKFKNKMGESQDETCFIDIAIFGRTAEVANQYLKRGSKILIEGRLKLDQWTDQNGAKRSRHSIVVDNMQMLDSKQDSANLGANSGTDYNANSYNNQQPAYNNQNNSYNNNQGGYEQPKKPTYQPQQEQSPEVAIPVIDVDEDEIPF